MAEIHLQEPSSSSLSPRVKSPPTSSAIPVPFSYIPSDDGTDENLLILLHGLGDTHIPFSKLGRQLKLPQTAVLSLRAPEQVPFLYEESYQWYQSFDDLGEIIEWPNPTPALELLSKVLKHLIDKCTWSPHRIHFFGFAQGGSVISEFGIKWWKQHPQGQTTHSESTTGVFGSIISVSGPLLSYPTLPSLSPTPILVVHSPPPAETALPPGAIVAFKKAYMSVTEKISKDPGMPSSREGWEPIMQFWSKYLGRRQADGLYEVMSGIASVS